MYLLYYEIVTDTRFKSKFPQKKVPMTFPVHESKGKRKDEFLELFLIALFLIPQISFFILLSFLYSKYIAGNSDGKVP